MLLQSQHRQLENASHGQSGRQKGRDTPIQLHHLQCTANTFRGVPQLWQTEASPDEQTQGARCCVGKVTENAGAGGHRATMEETKPGGFALLFKSWHHPPDKLLLCVPSTAGFGMITQPAGPILRKASLRAEPGRECRLFVCMLYAALLWALKPRISFRETTGPFFANIPGNLSACNRYSTSA